MRIELNPHQNNHDTPLPGQHRQVYQLFKAVTHHLKILSRHANENNKPTHIQQVFNEATHFQTFLLTSDPVCALETITSKWITFGNLKADLNGIYTFCYSNMKYSDKQI